MKFSDWVADVPDALTEDVLWRMKVYRHALFLGDLVWHDSQKMMHTYRMFALGDQLYRAVGSISANIAEGYSRSSVKDQARFFEYALGSAREARDWYFKSRHALGEAVTNHRIDLATQIIKQLLAIVPNTRTQQAELLKETSGPYILSTEKCDDTIPLP